MTCQKRRRRSFFFLSFLFPLHEIVESVVVLCGGKRTSGKWDEKWESHAFSRYALMCPIARLIMALMYNSLAGKVIIQVEGKNNHR